MGDRLREDRVADGDESAAIEADVTRSHARIEGAPVAIVLCIDVQNMDRYRDGRRIQAEIPYGGAKRGNGGAEFAIGGA